MRTSLLHFISIANLSLLLVATPVYAQKTSDEIAAAKLQFETQQAELNRQLEREKLEVQRFAAWTSALSLMIPLLVAALSLGLGVWSNRQNARLQREFQNRTERSQFELKAAELAFAEKGPHGTSQRARALKALFPDRLPDDFAERFDPKAFLTSPGESSDGKFRFFETVAPNLKNPAQLIALWQALFPADTWPERAKNTLLAGRNVPDSPVASDTHEAAPT